MLRSKVEETGDLDCDAGHTKKDKGSAKLNRCTSQSLDPLPRHGPQLLAESPTELSPPVK